jgi:hypothetical protein
MLQPPALPSSITAPGPGARPGSVHETYRSLRALGWSEREAGNLAAYLAGIAPTRKGWGIREVDRLMFIRALVQGGRIEP